jgi:hypothetical protein
VRWRLAHTEVSFKPACLIPIVTLYSSYHFNVRGLLERIGIAEDEAGSSFAPVFGVPGDRLRNIRQGDLHASDDTWG